MPNIVLIGMTGSGKTTIGKELASRLNLNFLDMDDYIENKAGLSIPEIFEKGEAIFRSLETDACRELADSRNSVISTGGGAVVTVENHPWLKKTGTVVWIDRPIDLIASDIDTSHRPLLKNGLNTLHRLYKERQSLYAELADLVVTNDQPLEQTIQSLLEQLKTMDEKGEQS